MDQPGRTELHQRLDHNLTLHPPRHPLVGDAMDQLRTGAKVFGHLLIDVCPLGRELSMALTELERALADGIGAIARNQTEVVERLTDAAIAETP